MIIDPKLNLGVLLFLTSVKYNEVYVVMYGPICLIEKCLIEFTDQTLMDTVV